MTDGTMTIPFGKYKGKTIEEIPSDYLEWMGENLTDKEDLTEEATNEYAFREKHRTHFWS